MGHAQVRHVSPVRGSASLGHMSPVPGPPPAGPDRQAGPGRAHQPGDRRPAVHQPPYRRVAPGQRVHKLGITSRKDLR